MTTRAPNALPEKPRRDAAPSEWPTPSTANVDGNDGRRWRRCSAAASAARRRSALRYGAGAGTQVQGGDKVPVHERAQPLGQEVRRTRASVSATVTIGLLVTFVCVCEPFHSLFPFICTFIYSHYLAMRRVSIDHAAQPYRDLQRPTRVDRQDTLMSARLASAARDTSTRRGRTATSTASPSQQCLAW